MSNALFQKISIPPTTEGHWKFQGGGLKAKIFKGMYEPKLEFLEGWGVQTKKNPLWGEYRYFLEQHNRELSLSQKMYA